MYKEEYEDRGFPFRDFLLKLILIVLCVFLVLWFVPKFISMNKNKCDDKCISQKQNKSLSSNLNKMKRAGLTYFTEDKVPKNNGEDVTITLRDMINQNIISIKNNNNVKYDLVKSYIKISKIDDEYLMKIKLKSNKKEKQTILHLNNYSYCDLYLCEKDKTKEEAKTEETKAINTTNNSNSNKKTKNNTKIIKKNIKVKKTSKHYKYKYVKYEKSQFSKWSNWSAWTVTDCNTKKITCSDDSVTCLKKIQRYDKKEQIGTTTKVYKYDRTILKYVGTARKNVCSNDNYVLIDSKLYKTTTDYKFTLVEKNKFFTKTPIDNIYYHYEFVSKNHYNVYKYNGNLIEVINNTCDKPVTISVLVYRYTNIKDTEIITEPVYKTVCYQSSKTRKLIKKGKVLVKWSKYNDKKLLKQGWILTKTKKRI